MRATPRHDGRDRGIHGPIPGCSCTYEEGDSDCVVHPYCNNCGESQATSALAREVVRLIGLINTPGTEDFFANVRIEAAHQIARWGVEHDAGKRPEDWIALVTYLLGKATKAHYEGDHAKLLHHVITLAAVALNWHRNATGEHTAMRPGIARRHHPECNDASCSGGC